MGVLLHPVDADTVVGSIWLHVETDPTVHGSDGNKAS